MSKPPASPSVGAEPRGTKNEPGSEGIIGWNGSLSSRLALANCAMIWPPDPPSGGPDMRRCRFVAAALMLIALASTAALLSSPAGAAAKGKLVLAWHAGLASRWLDPQEHDGTATPDNFFTAIHDALIKNQGTALFDHPALAEKFTIAPDAKSATFTLRKGIKFHNGEP